jgi:hypothetical protein
LRHLRNSNQIAVFTELRHKMESTEFQDAFQFIRYQVPERLNDPGFRLRLLDRDSPEARLITEAGSFLDGAIAPLVKHGFVDRDLACDLFYLPVVTCRDTLAPYIATCRASLGYRMWEDFEYLTLLCKQFRMRFPDGTYPKGAPALPLPEPWAESAEQQRRPAPAERS